MHHIEVGHVAVRQVGTHGWQQAVHEFCGFPRLQSWIVERFLGEGRTASILAVWYFVGVKDAVAVLVLPVVLGIDVEIAVAAGYGVAATRRSVDEKVVGCVHPRLARRVATHQQAAAAPVIYDVVHILQAALHLVVSGAVVAVEVAVERD